MKITRLALVLVLALCTVGLAQYEEQEDFSGTTISGRVVWPGDGETPESLILSANKNPETCCGGAEVIDGLCDKQSDRLLVNPENRGVANCVVYLADYDFSVPGKEWPKAFRKAEINQQNCSYIPHIAISQIGKKLTILNSDPLLHNIHSYLGTETVFNIPQPTQGAKNKEKLSEAGNIELRCDAGHTWMTAWVMVVEHPYYAVTDENGNFELTDVPDGVYNMTVWHEGYEVTETLRDADGAVTGYTFSEAFELPAIEILVEGGEIIGYEVGSEIPLER